MKYENNLSDKNKNNSEFFGDTWFYFNNNDVLGFLFENFIYKMKKWKVMTCFI